MVGDFNGWNNNNSDYQFTEQNDGSFTWSGEITKGYLRVISPGSWTTLLDNTKLGDDCDGIFDATTQPTGDKNIYCDTTGNYVVTMNSAKNRLDFSTAPHVAPIYSLIGDFGGHNWDYDEDFTVNEETTTATLNSISLAKGNSFKVRRNHDWAVSYAWAAANGHINITDPLSRGEDCLGDAGPNDHNIAVLHNGTYNFSLNYSTGVLTITGTRANSDSDIAFEAYISTNGGEYVATEMALKAGSSTEYMMTRDFVAGEKMYLKYGSSYYHYSDFKDNEGTIKGKQFVANGNDAEALYNGNYTIYFETATGDNFGGWFQYNSVSEAQITANVISYAEYFNDEVGGVCDPQGKTTVISDLQAAWSSVKTRYDNAPADSVRTAIKGATASDPNAEVKEFVEKYASVYELRGNSLSAQGGDFLQKGITPVGANTTIRNISNSNKTNAWVIVVISSIVIVSLLGAGLMIKRRKEDR